MPESSNNREPVALRMVLAVIAPLIGLLGAYAFVGHLQHGLSENYERYREFWGGNPSEVFSHWLDMVLMSGGAAVIAWLTCAEAFLRRSGNGSRSRLLYGCLVSLLILNGVTAVALDSSHGEGTVIIVYPMFYLPILASSYYLLRKLAAIWGWNPTKVIMLGLGFFAVHLGMQLFYEPSGTGGPNFLVLLVWLSSVGCAFLWALVRGIRTGFLQRVVTRAIGIIRRPMVWGGSILIGLLIGVPITLHAQRIQKTHQEMAFAWLDELEATLTDGFVEEIKHDHIPANAEDTSKIPLSTATRSLLTNARVKGENALRIFVPVNQQDYIFLWGNDRFQYCDIRRLAGEPTRQIDQGFIGDLIDSGGTHQTGLFSILVSPYMAGRVLKDKTGAVKAICVINAP